MNRGDAYPLLFQPILKNKVWGGRALERLGKPLPPGVNVGESWEVADLLSTSPDGGGGDAAHSLVTNGPWRGLGLDAVIRSHGAAVLGSMNPATPKSVRAWTGFPLLVKYLDARENLSVQVHPSPAYAAAHPGAHLKTEAWYIVDCEPGAVIYKGVKPGVTAASFAKHIAGDTVVDDIHAVPVRPGDLHFLPSGTVHALGAGVLVAEVQTPSDTTFRVYDWGRTGRTLHVEQALACIDFTGGPPVPGVRSDGSPRCPLVRTDYFELAEIRVDAGGRTPADTGGLPVVWMCLKGSGRIESRTRAFEATPVATGATVLLPATLAGAEFSASTNCVLLEARLPGAG
ncbi:MAG: class I mannose-6-phosphate isomerase [Phycisphaerales bacterium]|nr:class I mannose-6-phosphate isomerase [Phycisphaerales bacterium]